METNQLFNTLVAITLGVTFLYIFYTALRINWPENYFSATDLSAYAISSSPFRYALFRLGPVYITAVFAAVSVDRLGGSGTLTALGICIVHAGVTSGWRLIQAAKWPRATISNRVAVLLMHSVMFLAVIGIALLAVLSIHPLGPFVPQLSDIGTTIWTGVIAAILGAYLLTMSRGHSVNQNQLVRFSHDQIPQALWITAGQIAFEAGADVELTRAIMLVEQIQRPVWFRRLERIKGLVFRKGTYGIMQAYSERPLGDIESIQKVVRERLVGIIVLTDDGYVDSKNIEQFAKSYNQSPDFLTLLQTAYSHLLRMHHGYYSTRTGSDGRPIIEVTTLERYGDKIRMLGTASVYEGTVEIEVETEDSRIIYKTTVQALRGGPQRGRWVTTIPFFDDASKLIVHESNMERTPREIVHSSSLIIDLASAIK